MGLRGPGFEMFHWLHSLKGRFYHGGDVFTESLSCGLLLDTCMTVVRLRSTCVTVSNDGLHECIGRGSTEQIRSPSLWAM